MYVRCFISIVVLPLLLWFPQTKTTLNLLNTQAGSPPVCTSSFLPRPPTKYFGSVQFHVFFFFVLTAVQYRPKKQNNAFCHLINLRTHRGKSRTCSFPPRTYPARSGSRGWLRWRWRAGRGRGFRLALSQTTVPRRCGGCSTPSAAQGSSETR